MGYSMKHYGSRGNSHLWAALEGSKLNNREFFVTLDFFFFLRIKTMAYSFLPATSHHFFSILLPPVFLMPVAMPRSSSLQCSRSGTTSIYKASGFLYPGGFIMWFFALSKELG